MCICFCGETGFGAVWRVCDIPAPVGAVPAVPERIGKLEPLFRSSADGRGVRSCRAESDTFAVVVAADGISGAFLRCRSSRIERRVVCDMPVPAIPELIGGVLPLSADMVVGTGLLSCCAGTVGAAPTVETALFLCVDVFLLCRSSLAVWRVVTTAPVPAVPGRIAARLVFSIGCSFWSGAFSCRAETGDFPVAGSATDTGVVFPPCRSTPACRAGAEASVPAILGFAGDPVPRCDTVRWVKRVASVRCAVLSELEPGAMPPLFDVRDASRCAADKGDGRRFSADTLLRRVFSLVPAGRLPGSPSFAVIRPAAG